MHGGGDGICIQNNYAAYVHYKRIVNAKETVGGFLLAAGVKEEAELAAKEKLLETPRKGQAKMKPARPGAGSAEGVHFHAGDGEEVVKAFISSPISFSRERSSKNENCIRLPM